MTDHDAERYAADMAAGPFLDPTDGPTSDGPIPSGQHRLHRLLTDRDGRDFILRALGTDAGDHDVDAIVEACREAANGWEFEQLDGVEFWQIVQNHANDELKAVRADKRKREIEHPVIAAAQHVAGRTSTRYVFQIWSGLNDEWFDSAGYTPVETREEVDEFLAHGWPTTEKFPRARLVKRTVVVSEVEIAEGPRWPDGAALDD